MTGNLPLALDLVDAAGVSLDQLPQNFETTSALDRAAPCGATLSVRRVAASLPADPVPGVSLGLGGWTIEYGSSSSATRETLTYGPEVETVDVDLAYLPGEDLRIGYDAYDLQGLLTRKVISITQRGDSSPPTLGALSAVTLAGCADGGAVVLPFPSAEDDCGGSAVSGRVTLRDGASLNPPLALAPSTGVVLPGPGTYTLDWQATDSAGNASAAVQQSVTVDACVAAGAALDVQNGVSLRNADGSPMAMTVLGTGTTHIGGKAVVGRLTAGGAVQIDGGSRVAGDMVSAKAVTVQAGAKIEGKVYQNQKLDLPAPPAISGSFPPVCGPAKVYNADAGTVALAPGCYADLRVGSRTRVTLSAGWYFLRSMTIEPDAVLLPVAGTRFDVRDQATFRGKLRTSAGAEGYLPLQLRGTGMALLEAPLFGQVLVPQGKLVLGGSTGQVFKGKFYAKTVELRAGVVVTSLAPPPSFGLSSVRPDGDLELAFAAEDAESEAAGGCALAPVRAPDRRSWGAAVWLMAVGAVTARRRRARAA